MTVVVIVAILVAACAWWHGYMVGRARERRRFPVVTVVGGAARNFRDGDRVRIGE